MKNTHYQEHLLSFFCLKIHSYKLKPSFHHLLCGLAVFMSLESRQDLVQVDLNISKQYID